MKKYIFNPLFLASVSGLLLTFAVFHVIFILAWISLIPLFIALNQKSKNELIWIGLMFGASISLSVFATMIAGAGTYTGGGFGLGFIAFLIFMLISTLYWAIIIYVLVRIRLWLHNSLISSGLMIASAWVLLEFILNIPFTGMPWFSRHIGNALSGNLYAIQAASVFGDHALAFIMILVNYLFAMFILQRKWTQLILPLLLIMVYLGVGYLVQQKVEEKRDSLQKSFNVAIVSENIPPEIKWNDHTGKILVDNLLQLNKKAVSLKPDIILWSESAIPWTYRPDDDLINEILKLSKPAGITHLIGMNTEYRGNKLHNSVYCLLPDSSAASRYDKCTALNFIEKPYAGILVPFISENGSTVQEGHNPKPLKTPFGKAGVLICNESFLSNSAALMVKEDAEFLINSSNDGWFRKTVIVRQHFFATRLRAVETRKDIAVNSNNGISGLIHSSGQIAMARQEEKSYVEMLTISPNKELSLYTKYPYLWLYLCATFLFSIACFRFYSMRLKNNIK